MRCWPYLLTRKVDEWNIYSTSNSMEKWDLRDNIYANSKFLHSTVFFETNWLRRAIRSTWPENTDSRRLNSYYSCELFALTTCNRAAIHENKMVGWLVGWGRQYSGKSNDWNKGDSLDAQLGLFFIQNLIVTYIKSTRCSVYFDSNHIFSRLKR